MFSLQSNHPQAPLATLTQPQTIVLLLPSSAQTSAQLKLSLSSIFAVRPPSAIRKSIISNLILATTPKLQPLPSNLQPQLILPSSSKPQLCWLAELALVFLSLVFPLLTKVYSLIFSKRVLIIINNSLLA